MLKWTLSQMTLANYYHAIACHTPTGHIPETGHRGHPSTRQWEFWNRKQARLQEQVKDRHTVGPREKVQDQGGSGWVESLKVERGELGIH